MFIRVCILVVAVCFVAAAAPAAPNPSLPSDKAVGEAIRWLSCTDYEKDSAHKVAIPAAVGLALMTAENQKTAGARIDVIARHLIATDPAESGRWASQQSAWRLWFLANYYRINGRSRPQRPAARSKVQEILRDFFSHYAERAEEQKEGFRIGWEADWLTAVTAAESAGFTCNTGVIATMEKYLRDTNRAEIHWKLERAGALVARGLPAEPPDVPPLGKMFEDGRLGSYYMAAALARYREVAFADSRINGENWSRSAINEMTEVLQKAPDGSGAYWALKGEAGASKDGGLDGTSGPSAASAFVTAMALLAVNGQDFFPSAHLRTAEPDVSRSKPCKLIVAGAKAGWRAYAFLGTGGVSAIGKGGAAQLDENVVARLSLAPPFTQVDVASVVGADGSLITDVTLAQVGSSTQEIAIQLVLVKPGDLADWELTNAILRTMKP
jgi:hypothetical protein